MAPVASLLILILLEILSTTIFPVIGLDIFRIPFNILLILFMSFKLETASLPFLIFVVQYVHSFFTIEGWEIGTIAGIIVALIISYSKEIIHFSYFFTVIVTQIFQMVWFLIVALLFYSKGSDFSFLLDRFLKFLPESIAASLAAPFFFSLLDKIWDISQKFVFKEDT